MIGAIAGPSADGCEDASPMSVRRPPNLLRRVAVDITPLRTARDFRLLWSGELISEIGSNMALVALYIQVYAITDSALAVGMIGLVQVVPMVFTTVFVGPVIDRVDRRWLLFIGQCGQAVGSLALLATAISGHAPLAVIYAAAAIVAGFGGFSLSTRNALTPNLVPRDELSAAVALNQTMFHTSLIVGPAIGGIVVKRYGLSWAYGIDVMSFAATILAVWLMAPHPPHREASSGATGWHAVTEGFSFLRGHRVILGTFVIDLVAMIFGMPRALFPILAQTQFGAGADVVGYLFSAVSVGALLGAVTSGWVHHVHRQGLAVLVAVAVWGLGILGFGLSGSALGLALGALVVAGGADVISAVFRSTMLATLVPDDLRGRIGAVHILVVSGGPRIGDVESGVVAALFTPVASVVFGGLACLVGVVVVACTMPAFRDYRNDAPRGSG